jgi:hypothetical protein
MEKEYRLWAMILLCIWSMMMNNDRAMNFFLLLEFYHQKTKSFRFISKRKKRLFNKNVKIKQTLFSFSSLKLSLAPNENEHLPKFDLNKYITFNIISWKKNEKNGIINMVLDLNNILIYCNFDICFDISYL